MARIETAADIEAAISALLRKGMISKPETAELRDLALKVINHPELSHYYRKGLLIRNESEIFTEKGRILRPDRIVFQGKRVTLIDYKRGKKNPGYALQLYDYGDALESMGFKVENKIIVYINEEVNLQFI
jgi:CRISPR/Cas system-associated exonuclease Cas4 (RecB family)